jgi:O-antigen/teichoic acid export membrane protein
VRGGGRFQQEVLWNVGSLSIGAVCLIAVNLLVGLFYQSTAPLGIFNQVFAAYIFFSQFAALGIHFSVLKHVAEHTDDRRECSVVIGSSLLLVLVSSAVVSGVSFTARGAIGRFLKSPQVAVGIAWAVPGLFLFAVNKVLLNSINALRWMKSFAILRALRAVTMMVFVLVSCMLRFPAERLPMALSAAELAVLLASLALIVKRGYLAGPFHGLGRWWRRHLSFGLRGFTSGVMLELNTRVDMLMLGYFATDAVVGVYSFAAILAEGLFQFLVVLRNNYSPLVVRYLAAKDRDALKRIVHGGKLVTYAAMLVIAAVALGAYPVVCSFGGLGKFMSGWPLFATLMAGIVLVAGYMPFANILMLAGRPATHTLMTVAVVLFNIAANALLIPILSSQGAATATALAFVFYALILCLLTRRTIQFRL